MSLFLGGKPRFVVHPFLIVASYLLSTAFASEITPPGYLRAFIVGLLLTGTLIGIAWVVVRNRWDAALAGTIIVLVAVSPPSVVSVGSWLQGALGFPWSTIVVAGALIAACAAFGIHALRARRLRRPIPRPAAGAMNIFGAVLLTAVVAVSLPAQLARHVTPRGVPPGWHAPMGDKPDIVIMLLDGYPRSDVLTRRLGTDNTAFIGQLARRGFDVATTNHSNYTLTQLTFPSMFDMRYLDEIQTLTTLIGSARPEAGALRDAAASGQAFSILRSAGYEITMSASGWEHVTFREVADRFLDSGELNDLEEYAVHRTFALYLLDAVWPGVFTDSQHDRIVHAFDFLDRFAGQVTGTPRFLFLHVPAPHLPLVIRADGTPTTLPASRYEALGRNGYGMTDAEYEDAWQSEVTYIDGRVLQGVDRLLGSQRGREAVVVVMSDHGYGFEQVPGDTQARLANLLATRTPDAPGLITDSVTPVNLFRVLFNRYLGTAFPLLPNRYFLNDTMPLNLTEVSDPDKTPPAS